MFNTKNPNSENVPTTNPGKSDRSNVSIFFWVGSIVALILILTFIFIGNQNQITGPEGTSPNTTTDTDNNEPAH